MKESDNPARSKDVDFGAAEDLVILIMLSDPGW